MIRFDMTSRTPQSSSETANSFGCADDDHRVFVEHGLQKAEDHCVWNGLRFTPVRRKTLEILLAEHRALGAYEVLGRLHDAGFGSQPPVAYRALEFLVSHGFVHRIERLNAFIVCSMSGTDHSPAFMICRQCDCVAETQSVSARNALNEAAEQAGFQIERTVVEAEGLCPSCVDKAAS